MKGKEFWYFKFIFSSQIKTVFFPKKMMQTQMSYLPKFAVYKKLSTTKNSLLFKTYSTVYTK